MNVFDALGLAFHTILRNKIVTSNRILFAKGLQPAGVSLSGPRFRLDLDRKPIANDKIHFMSVSGTPEAERFPRPLIAEGAPDLHRQKMFEAAPEEVGVAFDMLRPREGVRNPCVEEVELRRGDRLSTLGFDPGQEKETNERIFEELVVLANR